MTRTTALGRWVAGGGLLCALVWLVAPAASRAALSTPDAMCYGRVSVNGQAMPGSTVSARLGDTLLDSFTVGSQPTAAMFYGLAVPVTQATDGETLSPQTPVDGSIVRLYVNERLAGEFAVQSGTIARRDLSGGQTLCSGGSRDGASCLVDGDCPGGFCVIARALCDGGSAGGRQCHCIGSTCSAAGSCAMNASMGTCAAGVLAGECCDPDSNCPGGACAGSQKLCAGGSNRGAPCLNDSHCPGSSCVSPTLVCVGGGQAGYSCLVADDCPGGQCGMRVPTPTPGGSGTPTATRSGSPSPTPTRTPGPNGCAGDCDGSGMVSISELIRMVNVALGSLPASECQAGDGNGDGMVSISELIAAVNRALGGC